MIYVKVYHNGIAIADRHNYLAYLLERGNRIEEAVRELDCAVATYEAVIEQAINRGNMCSSEQKYEAKCCVVKYLKSVTARSKLLFKLYKPPSYSSHPSIFPPQSPQSSPQPPQSPKQQITRILDPLLSIICELKTHELEPNSHALHEQIQQQ